MPKGRNYTGGSIVYFQGDRSDDIYVLQQGRVILISTAIDTGEEIKEEVKQGEFFGVKSSLANFQREETAQVLGKTQLIVFSSTEFEGYVLKNTRLIMTMARVFSKQLRDIHRQVRDILKAGAVRNPALELLNVAESFYRAGHLEHAGYSFEKYIEFNPRGHNVKRAQELLQMVRKGMTFPMGYADPEPEDDTSHPEGLNVDQGMVSADSVLDDPFALDDLGGTNVSTTLKINDIYQQGLDKLETNAYESALDSFIKCTQFSSLKNEAEKSIFGHAHYQLGSCQLHLGHLEDAQQSFSNYLKQFPTGDFIKKTIFQMGVVAESSGNPGRARSLYTKASTMPPPDETTREAQKRMENLD